MTGTVWSRTRDVLRGTPSSDVARAAPPVPVAAAPLAPEVSPAEQAIYDMVATFAFAKPGMPDPRKIPIEQSSLLIRELAWRTMNMGAVNMLRALTSDSWIDTVLNGVPLVLPRYTLMTMRHCVRTDNHGKVLLSVETRHAEAMRARFGAKALFLDIGAATGAMTLPFAKLHPQGLRIIAFEPSPRARRYLEASLERNGVASAAVVLPLALSDDVGEMPFIEMPEDDAARMGFLPEASRLQVADGDTYDGANMRTVTVETLDRVMADITVDPDEALVVKIDVEGFEEKVLRGGLATLARHKPFLSIDIHPIPGTNTPSDGPCMAILEPLGYTFEREGHVLFASVA